MFKTVVEGSGTFGKVLCCI